MITSEIALVSMFQWTSLLVFRYTVMIHRVTVFMVVRTMTVILIILTVYVTEQSVWVGEISNFSATKFWKHRQDTEHI
jgi:hypothetical protein